MLAVRQHVSSSPQSSIQQRAQGTVIIRFGGSDIYEMHSRTYPHLSATTIYTYDVRHMVDPDMHPVHGRRDFSRVYHGWYHAAPTEPNASARQGEVAIKWARGAAHIRELKREWENYESMAELQGKIVPKLFDYFIEKIEGVKVACLVMQWCGGMPSADHKVFITQKLELVCALHKRGWAHGNLPADDSHHFVVDTSDVTGNPLRIVDLTYAFQHACLSDPCATSCREVDNFAAMRLVNL